MSLVNSTNSQFNQTSVNSKQGVVCAGQTGGGFGSTNNSLTHSANNNLGKGYPAPIKYTSCSKQSGGAHDYDNDFPGQSYGFTKVGAGIAQQFKGSYAPITVTPKTNMCGGKKRRKKRKTRKRRKSKKRRRKNKSRKSRRKRHTKRRKSRGGKRRRARKRSRKRTRRKRGAGAPPVPPRPGMGRKNRTQRRKRKQGGGYSQYGSNIPITPSYSSPNPSSMPWATGPGSISRQMNCRDNYNHYKN
jgi:hypothetical protein